MSDLPRGDRILIFGIIVFFAVIMVGHITVSLYNVTRDVETATWLNFWRIYLYTMFAMGTAFLTWITIGGIRDLLRLFKSLSAETVDLSDDGTVQSTQNNIDH